MKVNEVVLQEGFLDDLRSIGRAAQQDYAGTSAAAQSALTQQGGFKKLTPGDISTLASKVSKTVTSDRLAASIAERWAQEAERINAAMGAGQAMSLDDYKERFAAWLEQVMKGEVRVNDQSQEFQQYITQTDPKLVKDYLSQYFIPAYQALKVSGPPQIPNGARVVVRGAQAGNTQVPDEIYTWKNGRWTDSAGSVVVAGSKLHNSLTQDAMSNIQATGTNVQAI